MRSEFSKRPKENRSNPSIDCQAKPRIEPNESNSRKERYEGYWYPTEDLGDNSRPSRTSRQIFWAGYQWALRVAVESQRKKRAIGTDRQKNCCRELLLTNHPSHHYRESPLY